MAIQIFKKQPKAEKILNIPPNKPGLKGKN